MIHAVPEMFKPKIRVEYPPDNKQIFEEWFADNVKEIPGDRVYLPVNWTGFQVNNDYGNGRKMHDLQEYIDGLDRSKKYFTITQYDDGPLVDFKDLDIKVFGSGGGRIDCPIPLVCMPHSYQPDDVKTPKKRKYLASFVGSITHPIRRKMIDYIISLPKEDRERYFIFTDRMPIETFCQVMSESVFALCPRGYGKTSFRICEALQYGAIPFYLSDEEDNFIYPFPDELEQDQCVWPMLGDYMHMLHSTLINVEYPHLWQREGQLVYPEYYTFDGCKNKILEWLKRLS